MCLWKIDVLFLQCGLFQASKINVFRYPLCNDKDLIIPKYFEMSSLFAKDSTLKIANVFGHFHIVNKIAFLMKITLNFPYIGLNYQSNHILLHLLL